jgi:hypothetical protein
MVCSRFLFGTYILLVYAICVDEWPQATLCSTSLSLCACGYQMLNKENEITKQSLVIRILLLLVHVCTLNTS